MAVYDYSPREQSPNVELVKQELAFHMGDIITVYGDQCSDGYFFGKVTVTTRSLVTSRDGCCVM